MAKDFTPVGKGHSGMWWACWGIWYWLLVGWFVEPIRWAMAPERTGPAPLPAVYRQPDPTVQRSWPSPVEQAEAERIRQQAVWDAEDRARRLEAEKPLICVRCNHTSPAGSKACDNCGARPAPVRVAAEPVKLSRVEAARKAAADRIAGR